MKFVEYGEIIENCIIGANAYKMTISLPKISKEAKAGQFVNVYTGLGENILPRPISINEIDSENGVLSIIYQIVGKGSEYFAQCPVGTELKVVGPLGNGFMLEESAEKNIIVGGGIGLPPLVELVKHLKGKNMVFIGSKTEPILVDRLKELGAEVYIATDDGSIGFKGNVVQLLDSVKPEGDIIYSCGPKIMLKSLAKWAMKMGIPCQVSMEERMACGIGACVGCAIKIKKKGENDWQHLKVCKDGPVFYGDEVMWDE